LVYASVITLESVPTCLTGSIIVTRPLTRHKKNAGLFPKKGQQGNRSLLQGLWSQLLYSLGTRTYFLRGELVVEWSWPFTPLNRKLRTSVGLFPFLHLPLWCAEGICLYLTFLPLIHEAVCRWGLSIWRRNETSFLVLHSCLEANGSLERHLFYWDMYFQNSRECSNENSIYLLIPLSYF